MTKEQILTDILDERTRQDAIWGGADHDDDHSTEEWVEYVEERTAKLKLGRRRLGPTRARELWLHVAALAVAAIESLDRNNLLK